MKFTFQKYRLHFVIVLICILISALANVRGTLFLKTLIDTYIAPFIGIKLQMTIPDKPNSQNQKYVSIEK